LELGSAYASLEETGKLRLMLSAAGSGDKLVQVAKEVERATGGGVRPSSSEEARNKLGR
jgi:hypothetical protein